MAREANGVCVCVCVCKQDLSLEIKTKFSETLRSKWITLSMPEHQLTYKIKEQENFLKIQFCDSKRPQNKIENAKLGKYCKRTEKQKKNVI